MRLTKRLLSAILVLVMVFSMLPLQAFASEVHTEDGGGMKLPVQGAKPTEAQEEVAARVELNESSAMISVGNTFTFVPTLFSDQGEQMESKMDFKWESSNPEVATVENGAVTGAAEGLATITCSYGNLQTTAIVSVTKATYQLTYEIDYPDDAKKVAYQNGGKATIIKPQDTRITVSCEPGKTVVIPSDLASTINYQLTGFTDGEKQYQVGESIAVSTNMTLKSCWTPIEGAGSEGFYETIYVTYRSNDKNDKRVTKEVTAFVLPDTRNNLKGTATFITANNNDTIATGNKTMCGWTINNVAYGLNQQVTVPVSRYTLLSKWTVDAYARYETVKENEAYAEFFVRKSDKVNEEGFGADKYFSIGSRKIKIDPNWDTSTRIDGAEVAKYLLDPPTAEEVANLMNESLPAGAVVDWNHLSKLDTGFHVDGVIRTAGKYWNVKFIDPDNNRCVQQVPVLDEDKISTIYDGNRLNTNVRTFIGWSFQPDGKPIDNLSEKTVNGDITLYALFNRKPAYTVRAKLYVGTPNGKAELLTEKVETDLTLDQLKAMYNQSCSELATHFWKGVGQSGMHGTARWTPEGSADPNRQSPKEHIVELYLKEGDVQNVSVTLTYDGNGEEVTGVPGVVKTIKEESVQISSTTPALTGYTFKGWNTEKNGAGNQYGGENGATTITLDQSTTLYAQWEAKTANYTVKHYLETETDGQYPDEATYTDAEVTVSIGTVIKRENVTNSYDGYELDTVKTEDTFTIGPDSADNVIEVYYKRSAYTVTYQVDGEQYERPYTVRYGTKHDLIPEPTKTGHSFSHWSVVGDSATIETGAEGKYITMPAGDVTIEGSFSLNQYKVSYEYGTGNEYNGERNLPKSHEVNYGTPNFLAAAPTETGYVFSGWYQDKACTKTFPDDYTMPAENVIAYGKFTKRTDLSYTVNYYWNGNKEEPFDTETTDGCTFGGSVELTDEQLEKAGYTLVEKPETLTIGADSLKNVINVYYRKNVTVTANSITNHKFGSEIPQLTARVLPAGVKLTTVYQLKTDADKDSPVGSYQIYFVDGAGNAINTGTEGNREPATVTEDNYLVTFVPGTLTITQATGLNLSIENYTGTYDGKSHTGRVTSTTEGTTIEYLVNGEWTKTAPTITDAGTKTYKVQATNPNYQAAEGVMTLTVNKRPVTLTSGSAKKVYDGEPLWNGDVQVTGGMGWASEEEAMGVAYEGFTTVTDVTEQAIENKFEVKSLGTNLENYEFTFNYGTLTIQPAESLSVQPVSYEGVYDGQSHGGEAAVFVDGQEFTDATVSYYVSDSMDGPWEKQNSYPTIQNVGEFYVMVVAEHNNYNTAVDYAHFQVTPKEVTVKAPQDATVTYGEEIVLPKEVIENLPENLVQDFGENVRYTMTVDAQKDSPVDSYPIYFKNQQGEQIQSPMTMGNYLVTFVPSKLTILAAPVTITVPNGTKTYGEGNPELAIEVMGLVNGNDLGDITYRRTSTVDNAGIYTDDLWPVYTENPNYTVTEVPGTLTILAAPVTITVPNGTKTYGQDNPELTMEVKGLVKENDLGEITYRRTSEAELVGVYADDLWPVYTENPNYTVTEIPGTLTIEAPTSGEGTGIVTKDHEDKTYNPGEWVRFTISAANIYNQPATLTIVEQLENVVFEQVEDVTMAPGETLTFEAQYQVTEADILRGSLSNTIDWTIAPNEGSSIGGTVTDPVDLAGRNSAMTVEKTIEDQKDSYRVGDVISFQILVKNTGNVTLHNLELTDRLINANGRVTFTETNGASLSGGKLLLAQLAPDQQWTVKCSYTVTEADAGKNIGNAATVTPEDGPTITDETDKPAPVEQRYTLTIRYLNTAGVSIHPDYAGRYHAGDRYEIASPAVAGYTLTADSVVRSGVMGEGDKTLVVVYDRVPAPAPDPDPDPDPAPNPDPDAPAPDPDPDPEADPAQQTEPQDNTEPVLQPGTYLEDPEDHTLTPIDEEETPLANVNLNGHTCCILHFLLMLAAMVVYGFDTKSRKKHQARIFELKRQLAMKDDQNDSQQS